MTTQVWPDNTQRIIMETYFTDSEIDYTSMDFVSVLPDCLTLDKSYRSARFLQKHRTLFREVNFAKIDDATTPWMRAVFDRPIGVYQQTQEELFRDMHDAFLSYVADNWESDCFHVVLHSSGYDSRYLSWALRELFDEKGSDWLGDVLFICSKWEGYTFKRIMRYEGWHDSRYVVIDEDLPDNEYYSNTLLDFRNAWREYNCYCAIPVNITYWPVKRAIQQGLVPDDELIQTWTTQWGNTVQDDGNGPHGGKGIEALYEQFYYSILGARPTYGDYICKPFESIDFADVVIRSSVRLGYSLRTAYLQWLDPTLAAFTNMNADGDRHRKIAPHIMDQVMRDYHNSWYGRDLFPNAQPEHATTEFQTFWHHWTAASLCEYLRDSGYKIKTA